MTSRITARLGFVCLIFLMVLAACAPAAPTATATPTEAPTEIPTNTLAPTETPVPTETPAVEATTGTEQPLAGTPAGTGTVVAQPTSANPPPAGSSAPDKYAYLGQDVADGSQFLPNRTVTITWTVQNSGTTTWTTDYQLRHFSGPQASQNTYNFTKDVAPEGTINFVVTFTTPASPGDYDMWFKLTNASGQNFGDLNLVYTVTNTPGAATATPSS